MKVILFVVFTATLLFGCGSTPTIQFVTNEPEAYQARAIVGTYSDGNSNSEGFPIFIGSSGSLKDENLKYYVLPANWLNGRHFSIMVPNEVARISFAIVASNVQPKNELPRTIIDKFIIINSEIPKRFGDTFNIGEISVKDRLSSNVFRSRIESKSISNQFQYDGAQIPPDIIKKAKQELGSRITTVGSVNTEVSESNIKKTEVFAEILRIKNSALRLEEYHRVVFPCWAMLFCYSDDLSYNPDFKWWEEDAEFKTFYGATILSPWVAGNSHGVDVLNNIHPTAQGWRLYVKRFTCLDYGVTCNLDGPVSPQDGDMPYFALYNIHTGLLRTFIYINEPFYNGESILKTRFSITGPNSSSSQFLKSVLANNYNNTLLSESPASVEHIGSAISDSWLVLDNYLSYVPLATDIMEDNVNFRFDLLRSTQSQVKTTGDFSYASNSIAPKSISGWENLLSNSSKIKQKASSLSHLADIIAETGDELKENESSPEFIKEVGELFSNFGTGPGSLVASVGGFILSGLDVFKSLEGSSTGGAKAEYYQGAITLDGNITTEAPTQGPYFGVHKSRQTVSANKSDLEWSGDLGLFSIKRPLKVTVYLDGVDAENVDLKDLININPSANMRLKDYRPGIALIGNQYLMCPSSAGSFDEVESYMSGSNPNNIPPEEMSYWQSLCINAERSNSYAVGFCCWEGENFSPSATIIDKGEVFQGATRDGGGATPNLVPTRKRYVPSANYRLRSSISKHGSFTDLSESARKTGNFALYWEPMVFYQTVGSRYENDTKSLVNGLTWDRYVGKGMTPNILDAKMKVALIFEHNNSREITYEFFGEFPVEIEYKACTKLNWDNKSYDKVPPPKCSS
ncbi:hypothetical protein [Microbulbifer mangrovi]|uniref:hypothetical protein n=1 Tax=Microbulbifer mangrovi TaxID=927787 RepID=UPI0009907079|nr:hypothetical protein [Microbulbifer mangrovi]